MLLMRTPRSLVTSNRSLGLIPMPRCASYRPGSTEKVIEYEEGTLILDIAEARSKRILWRGWAQTDVDGIMNDERMMEKRIAESVRKMIGQLPRTL
jgi:hypothetical protein